MKKKLLLLFIAFSTINIIAQVVPNIDWVQYYSLRNNIRNTASAIDADNNTYVTGKVSNTNNDDMIVLKYDSLGTLVWFDIYDNGGGPDEGKAIKVDANQNVYVAGTSYDATTNKDYVLIMYNSAGVQQYITRYDGSGVNKDDDAVALALDMPNDYLYIVGSSISSGGAQDITTVCLKASSGGFSWSYDYDGAGNGNDYASGIVVSETTGDIFVTGTERGTSSDNMVTMNIPSGGGGINWSTVYDGTAGSSDKSSSIVLSGANVVVCGMVNNTTTGNDYTTVKYDGSNGSVIWQSDYNNADDEATALIKDAYGNIVVTGTVLKTSGGFYYHTLLYDSLGNNQWIHEENINITTTKNVNPRIGMDTIADHFYISGEKGNVNRDAYVYQVDPTGTKRWSKSINGAGNATDAAVNLCVNPYGVVFLAANCQSGSGYDITTIKISQTPVYFPIDLGTPEINDANFVFQENKGQLLSGTGAAISHTDVAFYNQGRSPACYINKDRISSIVINSNTLNPIPDSLIRVDLNIVGVNANAEIFNYNVIDSKKNYFVSSGNPITNVASSERLFIPNALPLTDIHYYSNSKGLKTFFVFKTPGGVQKPAFTVQGATSSTINTSGELIAITNLGTINYGKLTAYQASLTSSSTYTLLPVTSASWQCTSTNNYKFNVTGYNTSVPLVVYFSRTGATSASTISSINNIYWSTFIGDVGYDITNKSKVDSKDNFYRVGSTTALNYPGTSGSFYNAPSSNANGITYGIMNKFDKQGALLFGTYYGGTSTYNGCGNISNTGIKDIAIDSTYNIYLVGFSTSNSLYTKTISVTGALNYTSTAATSTAGGGICQNAFVVKINPSGNVARYASYYGGAKEEAFTCVKYMNGQIYIGGHSLSSTIPLVSPQPNTYQITTGQGVYMHLDTAGTVKHDTKLQERIFYGDADKNGNFYLISNPVSNSLPLRAPAGSFYQSNWNTSSWDWGIQRFSQADSLTWSTFYGGTGNDFPTGICIRDSIMALTGYGDGAFTYVKSASDSGEVSHIFSNDIELVKFDTRTGTRLWSVLHGTPNNEISSGITLDKNYNLFITGNVQCQGTSTLYPSCTGSSFKIIGPTGYYTQSGKIGTDALVMGYNNQNQRKWTTYFGSLSSSGSGSGTYFNDYGVDVSVNSSNKLFVAGGLNTKNNTLPLVRWNNVCFYDSTVADLYPSSSPDGFISMFDVSSFIVGVKEQSKTKITSNISLFPNPNNGIFTLQFNESTSAIINVSIINVLGQKVYEKTNFKLNGSEVNVNAGNLIPGIYFITIGENSTYHTIKFIVD